MPLGGGIRSRRCFQGPDAFFPPPKNGRPSRTTQERGEPGGSCRGGRDTREKGGRTHSPPCPAPTIDPSPPSRDPRGHHVASTHTPKPARFCLGGATGAHPQQGPVGSAAPRGRCPQGPTPGAPRRPVRRPRNAARAPPGRRAGRPSRKTLARGATPPTLVANRKGLYFLAARVENNPDYRRALHQQPAAA